jgi:cysteine-rich repeat protein
MRSSALVPIVFVLSLGCSTPTPTEDAAVAADAFARDAVSADATDAARDDAAEDDASVVADVGIDAPTDAFVSTCGDGDVDPGEVCDVGDTISGDGCRGDCLGLEVCGDGLADVGEYCPTHTAAVTPFTGALGGSALVDADADGDVDVFLLLDAHLFFLANAGDATFAAPVDTGATELGLFVDVAGTAEPELLLPRGATLEVYPNTAASFGSAIASTVPTVNLVPGRFDADADQDLMVTTAATTCAPLVNDGAGHFTVGATFDCGAEVRQILIGDVDADGHDDAVFLHDNGTDNVSIVLGDGAGAFGARAIGTSSFPARGALGDVDRDGDLDLAHGVMVFPTRVEIVRTIAGAPQLPTHVPTTAFPAPPQLLDIDLDGDADLYNFGFTGTPYAFLRENDGTGDFSADLDPMIPSAASFADMNGDGAIDVVTIVSPELRIFLADP